MRIISGSAKGRRLHTPKNQRVRPTSDRVKEAVFNILTVLLDRFDECRVLDIFAGTGNLGIEALSRGAASAVFIDNHRDSAALIAQNIQLTRFGTAGRIIAKDVEVALASLAREGAGFELVFLDPPYAKGLAAEALRILGDSPLLHGGSIVVVEYSTHEQMQVCIGQLYEFDKRTYGDTAISFYRSTKELPVSHQ